MKKLNSDLGCHRYLLLHFVLAICVCSYRCLGIETRAGVSNSGDYGFASRKDCSVVSDLYHSAGGGDTWGLDETWRNVSTECCKCKEITCNTYGRVTEIDIRGLSGTLPQNLWELTELERLVLVGEGQDDSSYPNGTIDDLFHYFCGYYSFQTKLRGKLPPFTAGQLKNLSVLVLYGSFDGFIPSVDLTESLRILMLVGEWEGDISNYDLPVNAQRIQLIGLFSGGLPSIPRKTIEVDIEGSFQEELSQTFVSNLNKSLHVLIAFGHFSGRLPSFVGFTELEYLGIGGNFVGEVQPSITRMKQLLLLQLIGNFNGTIPLNISSLSHLNFLALIGRFDGEIPAVLGNIRNLTYLELVGNFGGMVPASIGDLRSLTYLELVGNFVGLVPKSYEALAELETYELVGDFIGPVALFFHMHHLHRIEFVGNFNETESGVPASRKNLEEVRIVGNFAGEFSLDSFNMASMRSVSVCCGLNIPKNADFSNMPLLSHINLSGNNASNIWDSILQLRNLEVLILDQCNIFYLPSLSPLPSLRYLSLSHNHISIMTDSSLGPSMEQVDLSYNNLHGFFYALSQSCRFPCDRLLSVSVTHNQLSDFVIMEECRFPVLRVLDLSSNNLGGELPSLLPVVFPALNIANFSQNSLQGGVPASYRRFTHMQVLGLEGNSQLLWNQVANRDFIGYGNTSSSFRARDGAMWSCENVEVRTAVGTYILEVDDTFQEYKTCKCEVGFYGIPPHCRKCSDVAEEASCPGKGNVYAPRGFWATPPMDFATHTFPDTVVACAGAGTSATSCHPDELSVCRGGYAGRLCSKCQDSYFGVGARCLQCMEGVWGEVVFIFCVIVVVVCVVVVSFSKTVTSSGATKVLIVFLQSLFYVWSRRSSESGEYVMFMTSIVGHWSVPGPSCFFSGWGYAATYCMSLIFPLVMLVCVGMTYYIGSVVMRRNRCSYTTSMEWRERAKHAAVFVVYFGYVGFSSEVLRPLPCEEDPGLKEMYMTNVPWAKCNGTLQIVSGILLLCVVLSIPVGVALWFMSKGKPAKSSALYVLTAMYGDSTWMWEVILTGRRVLLIIGFLAIPPRAIFRSFFIFSVLGVAAVFQSHWMPFRERWENILECASVVLVQVNYGVVLQYESPEAKQRTWVIIVLFTLDAILVIACLREIVKDRLASLQNCLSGRKGSQYTSDVPLFDVAGSKALLEK